MVDDGHAAATARRVAAVAEVTPAAVMFYFGSIEALYVALVRRRGEQQRERYRRALSSARPLTDLWRVSSDRSGARLLTELQALAQHREAVRAEFVRWADEFRSAQVEALARHPSGYEVDGMPIEPAVVASLIAYLARAMVVEEDLGIGVGVAESRAFVERLIARLEP